MSNTNAGTSKRALDQTLRATRQRLLALRGPGGHWRGRLSTSALSTATAVTALSVAGAGEHRSPIDRGLDWLAAHQNDDGGWGDTVLSRSNVSTTVLVWSAFSAAGRCEGQAAPALAAAEAWLKREAGGIDPPAIAEAVSRQYGEDRTFSAPILMMCAIARRLGPATQAWQYVAALPFELAACPHRWFGSLGLPVVSYALPALIAIGQARFHHCPPRNPFVRWVRRLTRAKTLKVLQEIQPAGGGFLEAAPLTSFVVMGLVSIGLRAHPVVREGVSFLVRSARDDGGWPIDTDLATWVTTLSVNALAGPRQALGGLEPSLSDGDRSALRGWLLDQQYRTEHPYTRAAPGAWAWTDLPGGVPDADDTPGALLAVRRLGPVDSAVRAAGAAGVRWLLDVQNPDGGVPTFCRGWGHLPFDRSSPDLTAHALRAWGEWKDDLSVGLRPFGPAQGGEPVEPQGIEAAMRRAIGYLGRTQRSDGSWRPLWFGNQWARDDRNPTYGTSRVAVALAELYRYGTRGISGMLSDATGWLAATQHDDGGWGGAPGAPPSIEETALAVEALAAARIMTGRWILDAPVSRGAEWLVKQTERGTSFPPAPIGLYFAKLWYFEELYPLIFTAAALGRARTALYGGA